MKCATRQLGLAALAAGVLTLALSGMRIGEANNLKVCDVQQIKDDLGRENGQHPRETAGKLALSGYGGVRSI